MANKRKPLNPPTPPPPRKSKLSKCAVQHCSGVARHWLEVAENKRVPLCHRCHITIPEELALSRRVSP